MTNGDRFVKESVGKTDRLLQKFSYIYRIN